MPAPTIDALPIPPSRGDSPTTFSEDADAFLGALPDFRTQLNLVAAYLASLESGTLSLLLAAIDAAGSGANKLPYYTGSNTVALADLTTLARTLLACSTQAAMRSAIGAGTGTGDLVASNNLSDLISATAALTNLGLTANGKSLVTAANYSAMRTLLGLVIGTDVQAFSAVLANVASSTYDAALKPMEYLEIALSDETTAVTTGDGKASWFFGYDFTITEIYIGLGAAQSSSGVVTVDVNKAGSTILSTKASIGASLNNSLSGSGSVSPVISTATSTKGDKFTADVDAAGTGAKGLKLIIVGHRT